jgi:phosphatidylglycerophosphatase C
MPHDPAPTDPAPRLVFFDLDGTVTRRDTLLPYVLAYAARSGWRLLAALRTLPTLLAFLIGRADHGTLKGSLLHCAMGGATRSEIEAWNARYLPRVLQQDVFPAAREAIASHASAGDHLVLMTATVDLYAVELGRRLGFDEVISSTVRWQETRLDGRLVGPNVRDHEKTRRMQATAERFPGRRIVAYGNSKPDLPHLAVADEATLVNASPSLRHAARDLPLRYVDWSMRGSTR